MPTRAHARREPIGRWERARRAATRLARAIADALDRLVIAVYGDEALDPRGWDADVPADAFAHRLMNAALRWPVRPSVAALNRRRGGRRRRAGGVVEWAFGANARGEYLDYRFGLGEAAPPTRLYATGQVMTLPGRAPGWRLGEPLGAGGGDVIARIVADTFARLGLTFPPAALERRLAGGIRADGWTVEWRFGADAGGEFLDVYSQHRMTNDAHQRIHASGEVEWLGALSDVMVPHTPEVQAEDRRVLAELQAKGFLRSFRGSYLDDHPGQAPAPPGAE